MKAHYRLLAATSALVLLAMAAWWRFDAAGPAAAPGVAQAIAGAPEANATAGLPAPPESADAPAAPLAAQAVRAPAEPAAAAAAPTPAEAPESAPETSVPGRSLAELERRARAGDAKAARDWADALMQCVQLVYSEAEAPPRYLNHLNWALVGDRRQRPLATGPLADECRQIFPNPDIEAARPLLQSMIAEALGLWAATGDPFGQLAASMQSLEWPPSVEHWQQQQAWASAYLDPANPQTLVDLAQVFAFGSRYRYQEAWLLAACDLGYDCSAGGALQMSLCSRSGVCAAEAYEEELLQSLPPRRWQIIQSQRRELLDRLRRGDARGVFDVPPPGG